MFENTDWGKVLDYIAAVLFVWGLVSWVIAFFLDVTGTVVLGLWSARHFVMDAALSFLGSISAGVGALYHKK